MKNKSKRALPRKFSKGIINSNVSSGRQKCNSKEAESSHEEMVEETENFSLPIQEADWRNLLKKKEKQIDNLLKEINLTNMRFLEEGSALQSKKFIEVIFGGKDSRP